MSDVRQNTQAHSCEEHFQLISREGSYAIHGTTVPVHEELYRCDVCGEEEFSFEQMQAVERQAGQAYRQQQGFLQPEEIRALRERLGLTQAQLEDALGLGKKTVARWEAGRVLQQRSLDNLLRAIDRFPQVLGFLAERQAVEVPVAAERGGADEAGIRLPRTLRKRLAETAAAEGTDLNTLVVMILSQGIERRGLGRELKRVNQKLDQLGGGSAQWSGVAVMADEEPWLREHRQNQREMHGRTVAS